MPIPLRLLQFGKIDAKNEILSRDAVSKQFFLDSFTKPESKDFADVLSGSKFLIHGSKGSGKTALLRYVRDNLDREHDCTSFVLFSEDISESEKNRILNAENISIEDKPDVANDIDVKDMWSVFLYRKLIDLISTNRRQLSSPDSISDLKSIFDDLYKNNAFGAFSRIRKNLRNGKIRISTKIREYLHVEASGDIVDELPDGIDQVDYSELSRIIHSKFKSIEFADDVRFCLFIDELNLSMTSKKQHKRDSILIRDLIITCSRLNSMFAEHSLPVYIYAAIRTEVIASKNVSQNEINKQISDNGLKMDWYSAANGDQSPIFDLIENKIVASERFSGVDETTADHIWEKYFFGEIFGNSPKKFIEEVTWCTPRDVVNLFGRAAKAAKSHTKFGVEIFDSVIGEYSSAVWQERFEELNTEYSANEISSIRRVLTNFHNHFKLSVIEAHARTLGERDQSIKQLLSTKGVKKVCEDLYHSGILGHSFAMSDSIGGGVVTKTFKEVWFHKSQSEFDQNAWMIIHKGLWPELKIGQFKHVKRVS